MKQTETTDSNVLVILATLDKIGKRMLENRASEMEVLVYQTCLLLKAKNGGGLECVEGDDHLDNAIMIVDSLWRMTQLGPLEDMTKYLELPFDLPAYPSETYVEAFHALLKDYSYVPMLYNCQGIMVPQGIRINFFRSLAGSYYEFVHGVIPKKTGTALDFCGRCIPAGVSFNEYDEYIICETDKLLYAYLVFRKDLEGEAWSNVEVINHIPDWTEMYDVVFIHNWKAIKGLLLTDDALIVFQQPPQKLFPRETTYPEIVSTGWLDMVISYSHPLIHKKDGENILFILRKGRDNDKPVTFVNGESFVNRTSPFFSSATVDEIMAGDPAFVVSVPVADLNPDNLFPCYYLLKRGLYGESTAPLGKFVTIANKIEPADDETFVSEVDKISTDERLIGSIPVERDEFFDFGCYKLSETSLLIELRSGGWNVGFVEVDEHPILINNGDIIPFIVKPEIVDIRFLVMVLRRIHFPTPQDFFVSDEDLLSLPIPDLSLEEQRRAVDDYLKTLKESFVNGLSIKESTINLLVATPDKETFEVKNKDRLRSLGFRVLEYVEDKNSLKAALSEHYGEKVLSSNLADAVLVCADMPAMDVQKAIYFVGKIGIRTFYYSNNPAYDASDIDEDYLDDFKAGFLSGDDYLDSIRRILDADSNKVRDRYPKFFKAADRLDEEYGWGLAEFATSTLQSNPFKLDINKLRSKIDETVIAFFKSHHVAPSEMDNTAVASLVADKKYYEGRKKVNITLTEELSKTTLDSEAWYKYALVAIRKLGNKDSHSSVVSDSSLELAAFTLFTEIVVWLDSVRERYKDKKCLFTIKKGNIELPFYTVESYDIDGREYLIANGIHLIDSKHELRAGDQVVVLDTEDEKYPKTINGFRVERVANPSNYIVAIKA